MGVVLNLLKNALTTIGHLFGGSTNKEKEMVMDAIRFPHLADKEVVEDHELAAFHNQA